MNGACASEASPAQGWSGCEDRNASRKASLSEYGRRPHGPRRGAAFRRVRAGITPAATSPRRRRVTYRAVRTVGAPSCRPLAPPAGEKSHPRRRPSPGPRVTNRPPTPATPPARASRGRKVTPAAAPLSGPARDKSAPDAGHTARTALAAPIRAQNVTPRPGRPRRRGPADGQTGRGLRKGRARFGSSRAQRATGGITSPRNAGTLRLRRTRPRRRAPPRCAGAGCTSRRARSGPGRRT